MERWAKEKEGFVDVPEDPEDGEEIDDEDTNLIPLRFKMMVAKEMLAAETDDVKAEIETKRERDAALPPLTELEEEERVQRVQRYDR